jgi:hypothetical protein
MKTLTTIALFAAATAASTAFGAATVNVKYNGTGSGQNVKITFNGNTSNVFAGQLKHTLSGATGEYAYTNKQWLTYCTDLAQYVTSTAKVYTFDTLPNMPGNAPMGAAKGQAVQNLFNFANGAQVASNITSDYATAFQLAIWEIVSDYSANNSFAGLSLTSGNFKAKASNGNALSSNITNIFNTMVAAVMNPALTSVEVVGVSSNSYQDQIFQVPAPGSLALAGLGTLMLTRRRKAR